MTLVNEFGGIKHFSEFYTSLQQIDYQLLLPHQHLIVAIIVTSTGI